MPTYISSKRTSVYTLKLRKTFFGLLNCAFHDDGLNPNTCRYIYSHIVLPKALYGCECLYTLTKQEKLNLERAHRLCVKSFQGMAVRARTDIALSMIGSLPINAEIEIKKLTLLGQLCRLKTTSAVKRFFVYRWFQFKLNNAVATGFCPDIYNILKCYSLEIISIIICLPERSQANQLGKFSSRRKFGLKLNRTG